MKSERYERKLPRMKNVQASKKRSGKSVSLSQLA